MAPHGVFNHIDESMLDELDIISTGLLVHMMLGLPIAPGIQLKAGPMFGFGYNDSKLRVHQDQAGSLGDARDTDSNVNFTTGLSAALIPTSIE